MFEAYQEVVQYVYVVPPSRAKQPTDKTSSDQSDSSSDQKIRLCDYDEARSELLIRGGKKVMARENFIFSLSSLWIFG